MPGVRCLSMGVVDTAVGPVLTHKVVEGSMSKSFGITVAKRAGLPDAVIRRAQAIAAGLDEMEASELWLKAVSNVAP
jgi:DNA mismatch repair protein MutS